MKRLMTVGAVLCLVLVSARASAQGWKALVPQVKISSPLLHQLGVHPTGHNMVVTNDTSLTCRIISYGKEVAVLGPGDAGYDDRHWEPLQPQIPVAALCYHDPSFQDYVGAAGTIFQLYGGYGYANSVSWIIREWDIRRADGGYGSNRKSVPASPRSGRVKFPREWWNGTGGIQIVNNSPDYATVRVGGRDRYRLKPSEVYYLSFKNLGGYGGEVVLTLVFTDRSANFIGTAEYRVYVPMDGVFVQQYVVGQNDVRR